jgi:hypothetical protein
MSFGVLSFDGAKVVQFLQVSTKKNQFSSSVVAIKTLIRDKQT